MRFVLTLASLLTVALLIFNGYANGPASDAGSVAETKQFDPVSKSRNVNLVIGETASIQREELEKQLR